jgi:hypothetical protein
VIRIKIGEILGTGVVVIGSVDKQSSMKMQHVVVVMNVKRISIPVNKLSTEYENRSKLMTNAHLMLAN